MMMMMMMIYKCRWTPTVVLNLTAHETTRTHSTLCLKKRANFETELEIIRIDFDDIWL